jgi:hypothetical protein
MTDLTSPLATRRRLTAVLVVLAWCAAVAVAATAGWLVVDRAGVSLLGSSGTGLGGPTVGAAPTASSTAAAGQISTLNTAGGRVSAVCTPAGAISLTGAFPAQGWSMEVNASGPQRLEVEFRSGSRKTEVSGQCSSGAAVLTQGHGSAGSSTSSPRSSSSTSDDHGGQRGGGSGGGSGGSGSGGSGSGGGGGDGSGGGSGKGSGGGSASGSGSGSGGSSGSGSSGD